MRKVRYFALIVFLLLAVQAAAQQDDINERLVEERARLRAAMHAEQSLLKQIYAIEEQQYGHEKRLRSVRSRLSAVKTMVQKDEATITELESELPIRSGRLGRRLTMLYRMGRGGFWRLLVTSGSFGNFVRHYRALRKIVENDAEVLARHRVQILALRERKKSLQRQKAQLAALAKRESAAALEVEVEKRKRIIVLEEIQQDKLLAIRLMRELENQDAAIGSRIASLPPTPPSPNAGAPLRLDFAERRGYLPRPVAGPIVGRFGVRIHSRFGTQTRSNGIDIQVSLGTKVRVVADGVVRFIGEFMGYGRVVIVDHGDRYHTLYAHLATFYVTRGDEVHQSDILGTVGSSGLYPEPTLHFEIRHQGAAIDPMGWLALSP